MSNASASFTIYIRDEDPLLLAEDLLVFLSKGLLQPKSMEIHLPGRRYEKVEGSIDGGVFWGKDSLPPQLPGEKVVPGTDFTTLEQADKWLTIPRDLPRIMERLRMYLEWSAQMWKSKQSLDDDVYWVFWGLCRLTYGSGDSMTEGYFLRQQLCSAGRLEPILRLICHLTRHPRPYFMLTLSIRSFVWSHFTSNFDTAKQEWVPKAQLRAEQENARLLAQTFCEFVRQYPDAEVEWETEKEHSPDLRGFLPLEFQTRLGPPNTPQRVRNLRNFR